MNRGIDTTVGNWRPPLIKLTQISNPDLENGAPTPCFVAADMITRIHRTRSSFMKEAEPDVAHPRIECTLVSVFGNECLLVQETPEFVALQRDRVLGFEPKLQAAKE